MINGKREMDFEIWKNKEMKGAKFLILTLHRFEDFDDRREFSTTIMYTTDDFNLAEKRGAKKRAERLWDLVR